MFLDKDLELLFSHSHSYAFLSFQDLKRYGATTVVRVCDITYDKTPLEKDGINVVVRDHHSQITFLSLSELLYLTNISASGLAV